MRIFRVLTLLLLFMTLNGCAVSSLKLSDPERVSFYDPPKDKNLVSVFLTCGRQAIDGDYDDPRAMFSFPCQYYINGVNYSRISSDEVGRVNVRAGTLLVNNSGGFESTKKIPVKAGEKLLLVTDMNVVVKTGAYFGLIGMAVQLAYESVNPPPKPIINPLTVYKNDFMNLVGMKEPVQVIVVKGE